MAKNVPKTGKKELPAGLCAALDIAAGACPGVPFYIPQEWAEALIADRALVLACRQGDMTGEKSCMLKWNGPQGEADVRLKMTWTRMWCLYHGDWQHDPHWTGD